MSNNDLIHPTAIIDPSAVIAADVRIGPYSIVGPQVSIGEGTQLHSHVVIGGYTKIGKNNEIGDRKTLKTMITSLRKKIEDVEINNVYGYGYKIVLYQNN